MWRDILRKNTVIFLVLVSILAVITVLGVIYITIHNTAILVEPEVDVGVYWDINCTREVTSINWGEVELGTTVDRTVYIKNNGTSDVTLSMNTTNWNPSFANEYITLSWDYDGRVLHPGDVLAVTFTLQAPPESHGITSFNFDVIITINE